MNTSFAKYLILPVILISVFFTISQKRKDRKEDIELAVPSVNNLSVNYNSRLEEIERLIDGLPDSSLKANLFVVLAAHYAGSEANLNMILQEFARIEILKKQANGN